MFWNRIYGYPEFDAVLQKALVAFSIKQINREVSLEVIFFNNNLNLIFVDLIYERVLKIGFG